MPVSDGDEEHVSRPQHTLQIRSFGEVRVPLSVRILHFHLQQESGKGKNKTSTLHDNVTADGQSHLTGVVKELRLMRVELVGVLWGVQADIFASNHLMSTTETVISMV